MILASVGVKKNSKSAVENSLNRSSSYLRKNGEFWNGSCGVGARLSIFSCPALGLVGFNR